jgi:hypothetical protein
MSMPEELLRRIARKSLSLSISKLSDVGILLKLRRVCKGTRQVVREALFQILTQWTGYCWAYDSSIPKGTPPMQCQLQVSYSASFAADTKQALNMSASWIVLVALSAACRTEASLPSVRMAIYTTAFQSRPDLHLPDPIREKVKGELQSIIEPWCVVVADRVSCALERSHVRPTREQILSNLRAAFRRV